jgi:hypothetical protein
MEALCEYYEPVETVVIRGQTGDIEAWRSLCSGYFPDRQVFAVPESTGGTLPGIIGNMATRGGTTAYVCRGTACSEPITDESKFEDCLAGR